jgi:nitrogen fixation protein NifU and related proteins
VNYSPRTVEHFNSPRNVGTLEHPTAVGSAGTPGRGNYMVIHILLEAGCIRDIRYQTYGCPGAIAAGSAVTELAKGKTVEEAAGITRDAVDGLLGGLPLGKGHCADLAVGALQNALAGIGGGRA